MYGQCIARLFRSLQGTRVLRLFSCHFGVHLERRFHICFHGRQLLDQHLEAEIEYRRVFEPNTVLNAKVQRALMVGIMECLAVFYWHLG